MFELGGTILANGNNPRRILWDLSQIIGKDRFGYQARRLGFFFHVDPNVQVVQVGQLLQLRIPLHDHNLMPGGRITTAALGIGQFFGNCQDFFPGLIAHC